MTEQQFRLALNPVRMRIIRHLLDHSPASAAEIAKRLPDIPQASLYRQMKRLEEAGLLSVAQTQQIRGAMEKKYELAPAYYRPPETSSQMEAQLSICLVSMIKDFRAYFENAGHADPVRDMLFLNTMSLWLTDGELQRLLGQLEELLAPLLENHPEEGRKLRKFTLVSSPVR